MNLQNRNKINKTTVWLCFNFYFGNNFLNYVNKQIKEKLKIKLVFGKKFK